MKSSPSNSRCPSILSVSISKEEAVVHGRSFVFKRRRTVTDFRPADDSRLIDLGPLHRRRNLLAVRLPAFGAAIRQQPMELGSGVGIEAGGDGVVHGGFQSAARFSSMNAM